MREKKQYESNLNLPQITTSNMPVERIATIFFLVAVTALYLSILLLDLTQYVGAASNILKYLSILCCALTAVLRYFFSGKSKFHGYIAIALCFTAVSDYFLLFTTKYIPGLVSFCVVQTAYLILILSIRGTDKNTTQKKSNSPLLSKLVIRTTVAIVGSLILSFSINESIAFLFPLIFYALSFISNIVLSFQTSLKSLRIGLILFFLCDINVFLYNLSDYISIPLKYSSIFYTYSVVLIWFFYLPAQVILTLLREPYNKKRSRCLRNSF